MALARADVSKAKRPAEPPVVLVTTKSGQSLKGVLREARSDALVLGLGSVASVAEGATKVEWLALDGDVVIPIDNVDFYQLGLDAATMLDSMADRRRA